MHGQMEYIVGVDIGGTFTDASAVRLDDGRVFTAKAPTTPDDLIVGLLDALRYLAAEVAETVESLLAQTIKFAHGTTQTSNIMFTWVGAKTGLITTAGFADEILMMRARGRVAGVGLTKRRHLRDTDKPPQIVPRERIVEVSERIDHRGRVILPMRDEDVVNAIDGLVESGVESIAVALLWSPKNPVHERRIAQLIGKRAPDVHVSLSHQLAPVIGEYERTSTTVVNAFVGPTVEEYLQKLDNRLRTEGLQTPLLVLQASGGVTEVAEAIPVNTIESGPAAGMVAVRALGHTTANKNLLATDVGGTTFKVGLLIDGEWSVSRETIINQYSLMIPMIDLVSIGSGGGSIAWTDHSRLRVGPISAGSDPGPACYGWGGTRPTVTDADLILGFLNPERFLAGRLRLDPELASSAIKEHIADQLFDGEVAVAAAAIRKIVDAQMGDLLRKETIERGHDPRQFVLVAYGGAGPVHAASYARNLGIETIIIPRGATAYSAYGAAASDLRTSSQRAVRSDLLGDESEFISSFLEIEKEARNVLSRQSVNAESVTILRWVDMRYARQLHDIRVPVNTLIASKAADAVRSSFEARYARLYGEGAVMKDIDVQLLRIGVEAVGTIVKPEPPGLLLEGKDPTDAVSQLRSVFWPELDRWVETAIYDDRHLGPGHAVEGPAVIEQSGTTVVVPPEATAKVDEYLNTVVSLHM